MPLESLADLASAGFVLVSIGATSGLLVYAGLKLRGLPGEVLQLWLFKNSQALGIAILLYCLAALVGLAFLVLDLLLPGEVEDAVAIPGGLTSAALALLGTWKGFWFVREVKAHSGNPER